MRCLVGVIKDDDDGDDDDGIWMYGVYHTVIDGVRS